MTETDPIVMITRQHDEVATGLTRLLKSIPIGQLVMIMIAYDTIASTLETGADKDEDGNYSGASLKTIIEVVSMTLILRQHIIEQRTEEHDLIRELFKKGSPPSFD